LACHGAEVAGVNVCILEHLGAFQALALGRALSRDESSKVARGLRFERR
jgi:hypothetical protein